MSVEIRTAGEAIWPFEFAGASAVEFVVGEGHYSEMQKSIAKNLDSIGIPRHRKPDIRLAFNDQNLTHRLHVPGGCMPLACSTGAAAGPENKASSARAAAGSAALAPMPAP